MSPLEKFYQFVDYYNQKLFEDWKARMKEVKLPSWKAEWVEYNKLRFLNKTEDDFRRWQRKQF